MSRAEIEQAERLGFATLVARFDEAHQRVYGYRLSGRAIQLVNVRVTATGTNDHAEWPHLPAAQQDGEPAHAHGLRRVLIEAGRTDEVAVYRFDDLRASQQFGAPAIVEYAGGTLFVPPGWSGRVDSRGNVRLSQCAPAVTVHSAALSASSEGFVA